MLSSDEACWLSDNPETDLWMMERGKKEIIQQKF